MTLVEGWAGCRTGFEKDFRESYGEVDLETRRQFPSPIGLALWPMAGSSGRLWRVVGSAFAAFVFLDRFQRARVVGRFLCFGAFVQLSALHGYDLPGLPSF